ncbi:hypothetical protein wTkk_000256 [Wolbachia endosymbiont of Trichogramma kaykai]
MVSGLPALLASLKCCTDCLPISQDEYKALQYNSIICSALKMGKYFFSYKICHFIYIRVGFVAHWVVQQQRFLDL